MNTERGDRNCFLRKGRFGGVLNYFKKWNDLIRAGCSASKLYFEFKLDRPPNQVFWVGRWKLRKRDRSGYNCCS